MKVCPSKLAERDANLSSMAAIIPALFLPYSVAAENSLAPTSATATPFTLNAAAVPALKSANDKVSVLPDMEAEPDTASAVAPVKVTRS